MEDNWLYSLIKEGLGYIVAAAGGIAWLFAWRERRAATKQKEANAKLMEAQAALEGGALMEKMQSMYNTWLNHYTKEKSLSDLKMLEQEKKLIEQEKKIALMEEEIRMLNLTLKAQRELCEACPNSNMLIKDKED